MIHKISTMNGMNNATHCAFLFTGRVFQML